MHITSEGVISALAAAYDMEKSAGVAGKVLSGTTKGVKKLEKAIVRAESAPGDVVKIKTPGITQPPQTAPTLSPVVRKKIEAERALHGGQLSSQRRQGIMEDWKGQGKELASRLNTAADTVTDAASRKAILRQQAKLTKQPRLGDAGIKSGDIPVPKKPKTHVSLSSKQMEVQRIAARDTKKLQEAAKKSTKPLKSEAVNQTTKDVIKSPNVPTPPTVEATGGTAKSDGWWKKHHNKVYVGGAATVGLTGLYGGVKAMRQEQQGYTPRY